MMVFISKVNNYMFRPVSVTERGQEFLVSVTE